MVVVVAIVVPSPVKVRGNVRCAVHNGDPTTGLLLLLLRVVVRSARASRKSGVANLEEWVA
jgi:hypothetical protein